VQMTPGRTVNNVFGLWPSDWNPRTLSYGRLLDLGELLGGCVFWIWLGWLIDTRRRPTLSTLPRRIVWTCIFATLGYVSIGFVWFVAKYDFLYGVGASVRAVIFKGGWFVAAFMYLAYKIFRLWRPKVGADAAPLQHLDVLTLIFVVGFGLITWMYIWSSQPAYERDYFQSVARAGLVGVLVGRVNQFFKRRSVLGPKDSWA
jgi:hypothetical protein